MPEEQPDLRPTDVSETSVANEPASDSTFASEVEEPRLSIQHLMIWAVCVAVSCSGYRSLNQAMDYVPDGFDTIALATHGLMHGSGLAGLVLFIRRRIRRQAFPRHPGEILWLMIGFQAVGEFVRYSQVLMPQEAVPVALLVYGIAGLVFWCGFYLYAIFRCRERRWKIVFAVIPAVHVACSILFVSAVRSVGVTGVQKLYAGFYCGQGLFIMLAVAVVVAMDARRSQRRPWTHWVGILLILCQFFSKAIALAIAFPGG